MKRAPTFLKPNPSSDLNLLSEELQFTPKIGPLHSSSANSSKLFLYFPNIILVFRSYLRSTKSILVPESSHKKWIQYISFIIFIADLKSSVTLNAFRNEFDCADLVWNHLSKKNYKHVRHLDLLLKA